MTTISEKNFFGKSTVYSCRTNVFIEFYHFMKKRLTQLKIKQVKQSIFKSVRIYGISIFVNPAMRSVKSILGRTLKTKFFNTESRMRIARIFI